MKMPVATTPSAALLVNATVATREMAFHAQVSCCTVKHGHPWDHAEWLLNRGDLLIEVTVYNSHPWDHAKWLLYRGGLLIEVTVYNSHPWDHAEWLLNRGGLLI